jgi:hypothetical protein
MTKAVTGIGGSHHRSDQRGIGNCTTPPRLKYFRESRDFSKLYGKGLRVCRIEKKPSPTAFHKNRGPGAMTDRYRNSL